MNINLTKKFLSVKNLFWLAIVIGVVLRFWGLGSAEIFHDEGLYAFRSIGYVDYIQNSDQTQPVQWFKDAVLPFWTHLSFHDHPPLFFIIQHIFFEVFGDSLFVARLPSALAGVFSIVLVFLIAKRVFKNEYAALLAAFLLAVNNAHVWVSRSSILESVLIFFIFLNIYAFLKFIENKKYWWFFGLTLGLVFLTKYTGFFLLPVYLVYLLIARRDLFRGPYFYGALFLAGIMFSPVIIYNFYLWKNTGHFDLQFAYVFKQNTPEWRVSLGKNQEPFSKMIDNLLSLYSISSLIAVTGGIIASIILWFKKRDNFLMFLWLLFIFITLVLVAVGSAFRFISLYTAPFVFLITFLFVYFKEKFSGGYLATVFKIIFIIFMVYETVFMIGGIFFDFPDFGIAKLDRYFDNVFGDNRSLAVPRSTNPHLDRIIQESIKKYKPSGKPIMIIYDENAILSAKLWVFARRTYYHGISAVTAGQFKSILRSQGADYFKDYEIYFVKATDSTSLNPYFFTPDANDFENFLIQQLQLTPGTIIVNQQAAPMFKVYKFSM
ncbi:MAG: hypothetical protein Athens101426_125 [Parcubacteria group bacterium Athens1014_26]|nr:MAG: hypothetical protein Athens101426_125 [Parcubacteria group bacterium Athens1014_26]